MSESSDEDNNLPPAELLETVNNAELSFLPDKSREKYIKSYDIFNAWRQSKGAITFSETILLSYFIELSKTRKPSTLWSIYSMLKATIKTKNDINIENYPKLTAFLKQAYSGHKPQKSKIFTPSDIERFLNEASDLEFLATKVVLIFGISGACRTHELTFLTLKNIEKHSDNLLLVRLPNTNKSIERTFVIRNEYVKFVEKYQALRPANTPIDRFFLQYRNGKCVKQPMGSTKIGGLPRQIATFLNLKEPELYTGHCFRRTSAALLADSGADLTTLKHQKGGKSSANTANTVAKAYIEDSIEDKSKDPELYTGHCFRRTSAALLADSGADLTTLKRHGGGKSSANNANTVAERYIEDSIEDKSKIRKDIMEQSCPDPLTLPSTFKDSNSKSPTNLTHSPTFIKMEPNEIEENSNYEYNNLPRNITQITNTSITGTKNNLTLHNITNCSNPQSSSNTVAEGSIEVPIENKSKICKDIVEQSCPDPLTPPSTSKDSNAKSPTNRSLSPMFIKMEPNEIEEQFNNEPNNLPRHITQITNTSITVPKKNVTLHITNCSNLTFNF